MATRNCNFGNSTSVGYKFPCPACKKENAQGSFKNSNKDEDGHADITASCRNCGATFEGTAVFSPGGVDVDITFYEPDIKDSDFKVWDIP